MISTGCQSSSWMEGTCACLLRLLSTSWKSPCFNGVLIFYLLTPVLWCLRSWLQTHLGHCRLFYFSFSVYSISAVMIDSCDEAKKDAKLVCLIEPRKEVFLTIFPLLRGVRLSRDWVGFACLKRISSLDRHALWNHRIHHYPRLCCLCLGSWKRVFRSNRHTSFLSIWTVPILRSTGFRTSSLMYISQVRSITSKGIYTTSSNPWDKCIV